MKRKLTFSFLLSYPGGNKLKRWPERPDHHKGLPLPLCNHGSNGNWSLQHHGHSSLSEAGHPECVYIIGLFYIFIIFFLCLFLVEDCGAPRSVSPSMGGQLRTLVRQIPLYLENIILGSLSPAHFLSPLLFELIILGPQKAPRAHE